MENYVNQLPKATPFIIACEKGTMHDVTNYVNSVENVEVLLNLKGSLSTGQMDLGNGECIDVTGLEAAVIFNQFDVGLLDILLLVYTVVEFLSFVLMPRLM